MTNTKIRKPTSDPVFANKREVELFFSGWLSALDTIKKISISMEKCSKVATVNPYKEIASLINIKIEQGNMMYTDELEKIERLDK